MIILISFHNIMVDNDSNAHTDIKSRLFVYKYSGETE